MKYIKYSSEMTFDLDIIILKNGELLKGTKNRSFIEDWDRKLNRSLIHCPGTQIMYRYWADKKLNLRDVWCILSSNYCPSCMADRPVENEPLIKMSKKTDLLIDRQLEHLRIHKLISNHWQYDCSFNY